MAETASTMLPLGTSAPDFSLPDPSGKLVSLNDFKDARALLVAFICNHCPYVKHIQKQFASLAKEYQARGVGVVAINSNDVESYPEDRPEKMAEEIKQAGYTLGKRWSEEHVGEYLQSSPTMRASALARQRSFAKGLPKSGVPTGATRTIDRKWLPKRVA